MNNICTQDIVYDTISRKFREITYFSEEEANSALMDSIMLLPIRKSDDGMCVNIYKVKNSNTIIKITYNADDFKSVEHYRDSIDEILAQHNRTRDDIYLAKKILDKRLYDRCCRLQRASVILDLIDIYDWRYYK